MLDGLFVRFTPTYCSFERRKIVYRALALLMICAQKRALCGSRDRRQEGFDCQNLIEPLSSNCIQEPQPNLTFSRYNFLSAAFSSLRLVVRSIARRNSSEESGREGAMRTKKNGTAPHPELRSGRTGVPGQLAQITSPLSNVAKYITQ